MLALGAASVKRQRLAEKSWFVHSHGLECHQLILVSRLSQRLKGFPCQRQSTRRAVSGRSLSTFELPVGQFATHPRK